MSSQFKTRSQLFPDWPRDMPFVDEEGNLTDLYYSFFDSLVIALQTILKTEGFLLPSVSAEDINSIAEIYAPLIGRNLPPGIPDISGQVLFDETNRVPKVFIITYDNTSPPKIVTAAWKQFTLT